MADQPNKPSSTPHRQGYSAHEGMVQEQMDSQVHQIRNEDERQGGAIPEEAGNDFTFPDEDTTLGKKSGDDIPGEPAKNRE
ncbi:hypothetical protein [Deinococcus pimensis]|uniref:hypothetical protein n=1 Tax=Deinococcus pimensis TaxID=309888 RepID=UPI000482211E|nr:hypothetical protein [Deinococcus pimensis]